MLLFPCFLLGEPLPAALPAPPLPSTSSPCFQPRSLALPSHDEHSDLCTCEGGSSWKVSTGTPFCCRPGAAASEDTWPSLRVRCSRVLCGACVTSSVPQSAPLIPTEERSVPGVEVTFSLELMEIKFPFLLGTLIDPTGMEDRDSRVRVSDQGIPRPRLLPTHPPPCSPHPASRRRLGTAVSAGRARCAGSPKPARPGAGAATGP